MPKMRSIEGPQPFNWDIRRSRWVEHAGELQINREFRAHLTCLVYKIIIDSYVHKFEFPQYPPLKWMPVCTDRNAERTTNIKCGIMNGCNFQVCSCFGGVWRRVVCEMCIDTSEEYAAYQSTWRHPPEDTAFIDHREKVSRMRLPQCLALYACMTLVTNTGTTVVVMTRIASFIGRLCRYLKFSG